MDVSEKLKKFAEEGKDWERKKTTLDGVFLLKLPKTKNRSPSVAVELNPVDDRGNPTKKRGMMIRNSQELSFYTEILNNQKVETLIKAIEDSFEEKEEKEEKEEVFEI